MRRALVLAGVVLLVVVVCCGLVWLKATSPNLGH
jgi:hypothetical protein